MIADTAWAREAETPLCGLDFVIVAQDIFTLGTFNENLGEIDDAAIFVKGNVIQWVGKTANLPQQYSSADHILSLKDRVVIPGMVSTNNQAPVPEFLGSKTHSAPAVSPCR